MENQRQIIVKFVSDAEIPRPRKNNGSNGIIQLHDLFGNRHAKFGAHKTGRLENATTFVVASARNTRDNIANTAATVTVQNNIYQWLRFQADWVAFTRRPSSIDSGVIQERHNS